jgi:hypothetical protein
VVLVFGMDAMSRTSGLSSCSSSAAFHTNKLPDPVVDKVGYWTDNGAYYYGDTYWQPPFNQTNPDFNLTCCNKAKLHAATAALDKDKVSMNYLQLRRRAHRCPCARERCRRPHPRTLIVGIYFY